jgi:hypothetical protein
MTKVVWAFLAIGGGFVTMTVLISTASFVIKRTVPEWAKETSQPNYRYFLVTLGYSMAAGIAGGYVTAWIARENLLVHALALAIVVLLLSALSALQMGKKPMVYQLLVIALTPIAVIAGGLLRLRTLGFY